MDSVRGIFLSPIHRLLQQVYKARFIEKFDRVRRIIFLRSLEKNLLIIRIRRVGSFLLLRIYTYMYMRMYVRIIWIYV